MRDKRRKRIRVYVVKMKDRQTLSAQWKDPDTGRLKRRSTGSRRRREAERFAAKIEDELNAGRYCSGAITWQAFRRRYEKEKFPEFSKKSRSQWSTIVTHVEAAFDPDYLDDIDAPGIEKLKNYLRTKEDPVKGNHHRKLPQVVTRRVVLGKVPASFE